MDNREKMIEALRNRNYYDFIANNYYTFTKEELKDILLEFAFELSKHKENNLHDVVQELKDRWEV